MTQGAAHAHQHHAATPIHSPYDNTVLPDSTPPVPIDQFHAMGIRVIPWTTDEPEKMRAVIRAGVDGLITDRPDLLHPSAKHKLQMGNF
jgi:glycerophosphoryl diester phosphodiesterase